MIVIAQQQPNILAYYPDMKGDRTPISNQKAMRDVISLVFQKELGISIQWPIANNNYMVSYMEYQGLTDACNISFRVSERLKRKQRLLQFGSPKQDRILTLIFYEEDRLYFGYVYQLCRSEQFKTVSTGSTAISQTQYKSIEDSQVFNQEYITPPRLSMHQRLLQTIKQCLICSDDMLQEQSIKLECGHQTHKDCMSQFLQQTATLRSFKAMRCPIDGCDKVVSMEIIKKLLPSKLFNQICSGVAESNGAIYCPSIGCEAAIQMNTKIIKCNSCKSMICCKCKEVVMQDHQCKQNKWEMIKLIQSDPEYIAVCCPRCSAIFSKGRVNQGCNHVQCYNCKLDLCALCSVDRYPTLQHGNQYHRQGCEYYSLFQMEYDPDQCEYCRKSGKACEFPLSLKEYFDNLKAQ